MIHKGLNTDLTNGFDQIHIQTEDRGRISNFVVGQIFCNGTLVKTVKVQRADDETQVSVQIKKLHSEMIECAREKNAEF